MRIPRVHKPPRTNAVPLNANALVNFPPCAVTKAPEIGVPVRVLLVTRETDIEIRNGGESCHHAKHCPYFPHVRADLTRGRAQERYNCA
jgi:hypothetical protein